MKITKCSIFVKSIFIFLLLSGIAIAQEVNPALEVNGDLKVNGIIKQGGAYADWYAGSYYSIPADLRTEKDWNTTDLSSTWTTVDLSAKLPQEAKRVRIYIEATGQDNNNGRLLIWARSAETITESYNATVKGIFQTSMIGRSRLGMEIEVDVSNGQFEIREYGNFEIDDMFICLRGFYM